MNKSYVPILALALLAGHSARADYVTMTGSNELDGMTLPFSGSSSASRRYQMLVLASDIPDIPQQRNLTGIAFHCGADVPNVGMFSNVRIVVCHTPLTALTTNFVANYAGQSPQVVLSTPILDLHWKQGAWNRIHFSSVFPYDNTNNLIVEIRYNGSEGKTLGVRYDSWFTTSDRVLNASDHNASNGILDDYIQCLRVYYCPHLDTDNDGLPDTWETNYFGNITAHSGTEDPDKDRTSNLAEYVAGTDPTNNQCYFAIQSLTNAPAGSGITLKWNSVTNRFYTILSSTNLSRWIPNPGFWEMPGKDGWMFYTNNSLSLTSLFFRVQVEAP